MDNLTHALTGVMLARAGLNKFYPRSTVLMILAANAPDLDIVTALGGSLNYLHYHRWITHSLFFLPVMALLPALAVCAFRRSFQGFAWAWLISAVGVASHLVLDWTNAYGVRLLSPVSERWFRLDITNVVDLWIWGALLLGLAAPAIGRLVSAEIGAKPGSGRGAAVFSLLLLVSYDGGRYLLHQRAVATLDARTYGGSTALRTAAIPEGSGLFNWRGIVEGPTFWKLFEINLLGSFDPDSGDTLYKPDPSPAIEAARRTRTVRLFLEFSAFPVWSAVPAPETEPATRIEVRDARFGFAAVVIVDGKGRVKRESFGFGPERR
jgi:inner membrane protein